MANIANRNSPTWHDQMNLSGVTTASLLIVLLVAVATGASVGIFLDGKVSGVVLATLAGFLGTVIAGIVRNTLLIRAWSAAGVEDAGTPIAIIIYATVASVAGSLAAYQLMSGTAPVPSVVLGMLAGLLSAALLGLLILAYRMNPDRPDQL